MCGNDLLCHLVYYRGPGTSPGGAPLWVVNGDGATLWVMSAQRRVCRQNVFPQRSETLGERAPARTGAHVGWCFGRAKLWAIPSKQRSHAQDQWRKHCIGRYIKSGAPRPGRGKRRRVVHFCVKARTGPHFEQISGGPGGRRMAAATTPMGPEWPPQGITTQSGARGPGGSPRWQS